jgi:hypothetical protein
MMDKNKAFGLMGVVLLVLLVAPSTLGYVITSKGKPEPDTLIAWPYISWQPSAIYTGSIAYLNAGINIITLTTSTYSIEVIVYDPYPTLNGNPVIVSYSLNGCNPASGFKFTYDYGMGAWVFYSGICYASNPNLSNSFGITASWQPKVPGTYVAEVTACINELFGGCESQSASLVVYSS